MIKRNYLASGLILILLAASLLAGCAPAAATPQEVFVEGAEGAAVMEAPSPPSFERASDFQTQTGGTAERIVIKNARLEIVVDKPDESMETIGKLAEEMGGYVVSANLYQSFLDSGQEVPRASITIRVPAEFPGQRPGSAACFDHYPHTSREIRRSPGADRGRERPPASQQDHR